MSPQFSVQAVLFPALFTKPLHACFDQQHGTSDGGAILLKAADQRLGLTAGLAAVLADPRQPAKTRHSIRALLQQRIYGLACGYTDANDAARLADDPLHKLLLDRDPLLGDPLASQPTLSRFENQVSPRSSHRLGRVLLDGVIARHRRRLGAGLRTITLDLDVTDDETHGAQQLSFFHGHYRHACYLPLLAFLSFADEAEAYLCAAVLRPGNASTARGALSLLRRVLPRLRRAFPRARILVRLDGGFAGPALLAFLDRQPRLTYVLGLAENAILRRQSDLLMAAARWSADRTGQTEHLYSDFAYKAKTWSQPRRVIVKAEVVQLEGREPRDNPRFLVTNLRQSPQWVYERIYCRRGEIENRIKELKDGLAIDRTSCSRFWANQFRVLLTAAAFLLMQEIRLAATGTGCARAQVTTLRERLLKLGAWVAVSVRRTVLHLPCAFPWRADWVQIARSLGAAPG